MSVRVDGHEDVDDVDDVDEDDEDDEDRRWVIGKRIHISLRDKQKMWAKEIVKHNTAFAYTNTKKTHNPQRLISESWANLIVTREKIRGNHGPQAYSLSSWYVKAHFCPLDS